MALIYFYFSIIIFKITNFPILQTIYAKLSRTMQKNEVDLKKYESLPRYPIALLTYTIVLSYTYTACTEW